MPKMAYVQRAFHGSTLELIDNANSIIEDYTRQGYSLTLRQLYYQFVSRDLLGNTQKNYSRLGSIINDARLAGLIDWNAIEDRTRNLHSLPVWDSPYDIVTAVAQQYRINKWAQQPYYVEVWIEKEALAGVFQRVCDELEVSFFACRGYTSQSEMWRAAQRLRSVSRRGRQVVILHFGDHDPSGIDMTRDIVDRLRMFGADVQMERKALNMEQVERYQPPPNPAKMTDSRYQVYMQEFGDESWELDALDPRTLSDLVRSGVLAVRDDTLWDEDYRVQETEREGLRAVASNWDSLLACRDSWDESSDEE